MSDARRGEGERRGLPFDAELRVALGVALDETITLHTRTPRTVLLERRRAGDAALPVDRDLALCVDLRAFPLADLFGWIHAAGKSGLLLVSDGEHAKSVWMSRGEVVFAASNQRIDRLGHSLVRAGVLTLDQLREAERGYRRGERFGKALVERGLLTPRALWSGLQRQVEEIVRSLFSHRSGTALFFDGDVQPDNVVRLDLPTERLVAEGMRWREDLTRFVAALSDPRVRIEVVPGRREATSGAERLLMDALAVESPFTGLCRRVGIDEPTVARMLQLLHRAGAVRIRRTADDPELTMPVRRGAGEDPACDVVRALVGAVTELVVPLVVAEGAAPVRERLVGIVDGIAERRPALLARIEIAADAALDADALIERMRRDPAVSLAEVVPALRELVEYLEFELKNHPGVRDAEAVLSAAAALRATVRA